MVAGRPTEYSEEIINKTQDYLENHKDYGDVVPSVAGLSVHLKIARSTIYDWASQESKKEFSDILQDILSSQEKQLLNGSLTNKLNANIAKLMLGKHGYSDKSDVDMTSQGEKVGVVMLPQKKDESSLETTD